MGEGIGTVAVCAGSAGTAPLIVRLGVGGPGRADPLPCPLGGLFHRQARIAHGSTMHFHIGSMRVPQTKQSLVRLQVSGVHGRPARSRPSWADSRWLCDGTGFTLVGYLRCLTAVTFFAPTCNPPCSTPRGAWFPLLSPRRRTGQPQVPSRPKRRWRQRRRRTTAQRVVPAQARRQRMHPTRMSRQRYSYVRCQSRWVHALGCAP